MSDIGIGCQGVYNIKDGSKMYTEVLVRRYAGLTGAENIIRWAHENGKCEEMDCDIIAYTLGLINDIHSCNKYAFNLCDETIESKGIAHRISDIIDNYGMKGSVMIEITEDTDFNNDTVIGNIRELSDLGIPVILDDFGKSNSNIESLVNIKFSIVKIDKEYVQRAISKNRQLRILIGVVGLLDNLGITTVIEGVELSEHLRLADIIGVQGAQGYYLERPRGIY